MCSPATQTCERSPTDPDVDAAIDSPIDTPNNLPSFSELSGQQWLMPCKAAPNPTLCDADDSTKTVTVGGNPSITYSVKVRIRGVMERGTYQSGMVMGNGGWYVGGATTSTFLTVAELRVAQPTEHYFLNSVSGTGNIHFDYEATLPIRGGSMVTLFMSALDGRAVTSSDAVIAGVTTTPSPYLGQFAQIDVVSVGTP